ncbi:MAG: DTW domain-containing protein [Chitinispirillaceae bacterium]|nr:DTW domain-containing protein [Chitinispirillaceae bacterium]
MPHAFIPTDPRAKQKFDRASVCDGCYRSKKSCICGRVSALDTRLRVVILQHPQEQFKVLNSARLSHLLLKNSSILTGLSWPNFKKVAGAGEIPSLWGVLYLKTGPDRAPAPIVIVNRNKQPVADASFLRGIIAIDGTWKQAKTVWWRNPWLTRLNRITLNPDTASLRPQVKGEGLSTIEALAFALEHLGENREIADTMRQSYRELLIGNA